VGIVQIFSLKHPMDFDVDRLVSLFFQRPVFNEMPASLRDSWANELTEILGFVKSPGGAKRKAHEMFMATAKLHGDKIIVEIVNCGFPFKLEEFHKRFGHLGHIEVSSISPNREGQFVSIQYPYAVTPPTKSQVIADDSNQEVDIRELRKGEEYEVSKLFYNVYRYRYINQNVYDPHYIAREIAEGRLISYVGALPSGTLVSHVGIVECNGDPKVYEAAWGVVDPKFANRGVFKRNFEATLARMQSLNMSYGIYDFVTNHDFSQRLVAKYGYADMALFVGNQVSETQARLEELGVAKDAPGMERYSLLLGIDMKGNFPFGQRIRLPINIGETVDFLLNNLGMTWEPTNRFESLPIGGHYTLKIHQEQKSVVFNMYDVGRSAVERIIADLSHHLRSGLEYAAVDFPLNVPGVGYIHDALADAGFFMAGLMPYGFANQLGFRMQFLTPADVDFDAIKVFSPVGQRLKQIVKDEWERNHLI
jgi:hypothetical protein